MLGQARVEGQVWQVRYVGVVLPFILLQRSMRPIRASSDNALGCAVSPESHPHSKFAQPLKVDASQESSIVGQLLHTTPFERMSKTAQCSLSRVVDFVPQLSLQHHHEEGFRIYQ